MKFLTIICFIILFVALSHQQTMAQPRLVSHFSSEIIGEVGIIFFGTPGPNQVGLVSTLDGNLNRTTDDGKTWNVVFTAVPNDVVTYLTFKDSLEGWASANKTFIHTIDGGLTWQTFLINGAGGAKIHYVPSSGYLFAENCCLGEYFSSDHGNTWLSNTHGQPYFGGDSLVVGITMWVDSITSVSSDGGVTWLDKSIPYSYPAGFGHAIFGMLAADSVPVDETGGDTTFLSTDLGKTWRKGGDMYDFDCDFDCCEWGNSGPFILGPSGAIYSYDEEFGVFVTTDTGLTWQVICVNGETSFPFMDVCEPIIYIAAGQDLFAYPDRPPRQGLAYLVMPNPFVGDTTSILENTGYCATIEQIYLTGSPSFSLQAFGTSPKYSSYDSNFYVISHSEAATCFDTAQLHIQYLMQCQNETFDTTITLYGETPGPSLMTLNLYFKSQTITTAAGDTLEIPIYLSGNTALGTTSITLAFGIDTNVLRPIGFVPSMSGITVGTLAYANGTETVQLQSVGLTINGETLIGYLRCIVYLADTLATTVTLANASLTSTIAPCVALSLTTDSVNLLINGCGDQTLLQFMKTGQIPLGIQSIVPNPSTDAVQISFINPTSSAMSYHVFDALGQTRHSGVTASDALSLDVSSLPQGVYFFRATNGTGYSASSKLVIVR
jgi:photosystem II stability/assembly factor-like uncharacterized protein